jgi:hypothetical protein
MLSSVLRSPRAIAVNVEIMRAFVRLRRMLASNADLARKLADLSGVLAYGVSREEAIRRAKALALRVLADRREHGEQIPELMNV